MTLSASITTTLATLTPYIVSLVALLVFLEQISYLKKKRSVPGPLLIFPFLGNAANLVRDPTRFWDAQTHFAKSSGFSANYIVGKFIIFIRSSELSHKIFSNVRPDAFHLVGHPFGKKLFGEHNLIYMFGEAHKSLRRRIAPNFTVKALRTYTEIQQRIIFRHIRRWLDVAGENDSPVAMRLLVRDMNLETSQTVFVGPYLADESRRRFEADYNLFNVGLMKLPVDLPGFAFRNARFAVERLVDALGTCAERSVERMERGEEPSCLIDFWMQDTIRESAGSESAAVSHSSVRENAESAAVSDSKVRENGESPAVFHSSVRENGESEAISGSPVHENGGSPAVSQPSCREIGGHLFDFLFAAQDASTSSLLWAVTLLESHPEVLRKVREEVAGIWSPDSGSLITAEKLAEMRYTLAVAREVVRYRAPATMVPHIAGEDFPLTESYTIPKGTIVFPSVFESSFQGFTEADRFDPDRFSADRQEDRVFKRNFLAFGAGPHQCVGQRYALNHLVLFIAIFTAMVDFKRHRTDGCDEIMYVPTICPKDDCKVYLSPRCSKLHAPE